MNNIIRPILRGRDIKKYGYEFADLWLLYIPWHFPLHTNPNITGASEEAEREFQEQYPEIYDHLLKHKKELSARNKAETGIRYEWYALQRWGANYMDDFSKQKIVWLTITDKPKFAMDLSKSICLNSIFFMVGNDFLYTILASLNSKLIEWYFDGICVSTGVGTNKWEKFVVERIPIPKSNTNIENTIEKMLYEQKYKDVDRLIFELYNLTEEEINFIELQ